MFNTLDSERSLECIDFTMMLFLCSYKYTTKQFKLVKIYIIIVLLIYIFQETSKKGLQRG